MGVSETVISGIGVFASDMHTAKLTSEKDSENL